MKIISWNVNGIRACHTKNELQTCIQKHNPDVIFFQEIKATHEQVKDIENAFPEYSFAWNPAQKPGYAGTSVWVKNTLLPVKFLMGMPDFEDTEGRIIGIEKENTVLFGVYFPNGGKSPQAWQDKLQFYQYFDTYMQYLHQEEKTVLFGGDINVAHNAIDLARPKDNEGNIGFHPLERAEIDIWIQNGWRDIWREKNQNTIEYSWWTYRGGAREKNVGWRIDSFFIQEKHMPKIQNIFYDQSQMGSDHCPLIVELCTK